MSIQLSTQEVFKLLQARYDYFEVYSGFSENGSPNDAEAHNDVVDVLKAAVESFSQGRLQVVVK